MPDTYIIIRRISNKNSMKKHFLLLILSLLFLPIAQGKVKLPAIRHSGHSLGYTDRGGVDLLRTVEHGNAHDGKCGATH